MLMSHTVSLADQLVIIDPSLEIIWKSLVHWMYSLV